MQNAIYNLADLYFRYEYGKLHKNISQVQKEQEKLWKKTRRNLKGTKIYNDLKLEHLETYDEYVRHLEVNDFDFYAPYVEQILNGEENVLFKGRPHYFGLTSGTSGKDSKKIPYNNQMISLFKKSQKLTGSIINNSSGNVNVLRSKRLSYGSAPVCYEKNGFTFGYISGILSAKTPKLLKKNTYPKLEVMMINDWDEKIERLIEESIVQDIQIISGIPTYFITIFEAILKKTGKKSICEIWPNITSFVYGATPIDQYKDRINELVGKPLQYFGIYAATEAPLGLSFHSLRGEHEYIFQPGVLYSFSPVEEPNLRLPIKKIKEGREYFLNIGTPNGFLQYTMKDVVKIKNTDGILTFDIMGRKGSGMNLAAEKVSEKQILNTISKTRNDLKIEIEHYFVSPTSKKGKPCYHWTLFVDKNEFNKASLIEKKLDEYLNIECGDYEDCRVEAGILEEPKVTLMAKECLTQYFEKNRDRGQFKMKTTFQFEEEYQKFLKTSFDSLEFITA